MSRLRGESNTQSIRTVFLQIAAMSALAVGQPLLQLVKDNPEFLTVHQSQRWDVVILAIVLLLAVPAILSAVVRIAGLVGPSVEILVQSVVLGGLFALFLMPVLDRVPGIAGWMTLGLGVAAGITFAMGYVRSGFIRRNLAILALVLPIFLVLFFGAAPIRKLLFPARIPVPVHDQMVTDPVVMIILDELPTSSLMGPDGELDCQLFPNFCRLAAQSTWYRNATSISGATLRSVPAIMTGKRPSWHETPSFADHPDNIFSLLASSHHISALETQTSVCPDELKSEPTPRLSARLELLLDDLGVLYQHIVVPEKWRDRLAPISDKWGNFRVPEKSAGGPTGYATRVAQFEQFVASLGVSDRPDLVVAHILLPHSPFQFLPDGRVYNWRKKIPALADGVWGADTEVIAHSYRRHLLQVAAVDRLLGLLLDRLEALDILDDAAIVVTADHGISFKAGRHRRKFSDAASADIMFVPLFLKAPGQHDGKIDDRFAQTLDIMPTLASVLGCELAWDCDGVDLSTKPGDREELVFFNQEAKEELSIGLEIGQDRSDIIEWKHELFGAQGGVDRLFDAFDPGGFIGRTVSSIDVRPHGTLRGRIIEAPYLEQVDLSSWFVPAEINGTIEGHEGDGRLTLALAINGTIAGSARTYLNDPDSETCRWQITVPPDLFRDGANQAELFVVNASPSGTDLVQVPVFTPSFLGTDLGGAQVSGILESGLFSTHAWDGRPTRWTDGQGRWEVPIKAGERPKVLRIGIISSGPPGTELSVKVNGLQLLRQFLPPGEWETRLPLDGVDIDTKLTIVLESGVFVPAEVDSASNDHRELGVAVTTLVVN